MDSPRIKFVSHNMAEVRPKLKLYGTVKSEKMPQPPSVTMDDILRSVKTLDDSGTFKKVEKPVVFSKSVVNMKKFQPCSSLDQTDTANPVLRESCASPEFTKRESGPADAKTINDDNDDSRRSPILLSEVSFQHNSLKAEVKLATSSAIEDKLCSSQSIVCFKSLLGTHSSLENPKWEENCGRSTDVKLDSGTGFCTAKGKNVVVSEKSLAFASSLLGSLENESKPDERSCESASSNITTTLSQSVIPNNNRKSLFSTASGKTMTVSSANLRKAKTLFDKCSEESRPVNSSTSHDKEVVDCNLFKQHNDDSTEVLPFMSETTSDISQICATTGFSTAGGENVIVSQENLKIASQLLESLDTGEILISSGYREPKVSPTVRKSMFQSASGKVACISSANLRKAKNLLDSLNENSTEVNASSQLEKESVSDNDSQPGNGCPNLCTPESAALLENDSELFKAIETPSKTRKPSSRDTRVPQNNGAVKNGPEPNAERDSHPANSKVDLQSSLTAFNESGIATQVRNGVYSEGDRIPTLFRDTIEANPEKETSPGSKSPVLMKVPLLGNSSPHILQYPTEQRDCRKDKKNSSADTCSAGESSTSIHEKVVFPPAERNVSAHTESGHKNTLAGSMCFKSSSGKTVEPSAARLNKVRSLLSDMTDEDMDGQMSSYSDHGTLVAPEGSFSESVQKKGGSNSSLTTSSYQFENIKTSPKNRNSSKVNACTPFKSAAGKSVEVSDESVARVKALFNDLLEEEIEEKVPGCDETQINDNVNKDDLDVPHEFSSPVLLDGSFVEKIENPKDVEKNPEDDGWSRSPVLSRSFVEPEEQLSLIENTSRPLVASQVYSRIASLKDDLVFSSPDWGEFPDLKSSQAALLERQVDSFSRDLTAKENVGLAANRQNETVDWVEFPEMPNVEMCDLKQNRNRVIDAKNNRGLTKTVLIESGLEIVHQEPSLLSSSVTIERVTINKKPSHVLPDEDSRKRKSGPVTPLNTSKRSRTSSSPRISGSPNKLAVRKRIREEQCVIVRSKKNRHIAPLPGKLFTAKKGSCRWQLNELDDELRTLNVDDVEVPISKAIIDITSENSVDYRFRLSNARAKTMKFDEGDLIADSCLLAFADDDTAGLKEVTTSFLTSPHVDPKLIPNGWIRNHYRWIVWKLACLERIFPQQFGASGLTLENVLLQLKYRYDREIDMVQRSSFKKLLEGDAAPNKFICCVAAVKKNSLDEGESLLELELSDGWYSIWTVVDSEMVELVKRDVVGIGTKLIVHSAELTGCEQGCDPLNVPSSVKLKISTNSVRRVKWFAKMGFTPNSNPIPALLCSVLPNGGFIGQVTAVVARTYPVIYMCKDGDGKTVFRNERSQALYRELQDKMKSDRAEQVYEQVWKEVESKYRKTGKSFLKLSSKEIQNITDPELLFNIMDGSDAEFMQSLLSADQLRLVMQYKDETMAKIKNDVQKVLQDKLSESEPTSKVTKLLKVRLTDFFTDKHALLTIWRPSEEDLCVLREGKAFEFLNLMASGTRDKVLQLSSTRQTTYSSNEMLEPSEDCCRTVTPLKVVDTPRFAPIFGEIDVVGVIVLVKLPEQTRGVTVVYLSDLEGHYLSITFWTSLSVFGCEDLMTEGSIISCSNLQWRSVSSQRKIPSVFASEITSFSLNPKESHLHQGVAELKAKLADKEVGELVTSARSDILQMTGCRDLMSSPVPSSPTSSCRGTPAHKKLKLMSRVGDDAPPLSPIPLTVTTRHVFQNFKSPCQNPLRRGKSKTS